VRIEGEGSGRIRTDERFGRMIGRSPAMQLVFDVLSRAASSDATIMLEGETGTGKEVSAEAIHVGSARRDKPFLVVDCGAMPPQLLESELFGHERGAFTGAVASRQGVFEAASGGTVFLDEIGELSIDLQPKLLRVLERREVRRVGTNIHVPVNVRLVAATNRSLREQVAGQKFRSDLYYRLAVVEVKLPPLRERLADLPLLVEHIVRGLGNVDPATLARVRSQEFHDGIARHSWPGNIRELRNVLERAMLSCAGVRIEASDLSLGGAAAPAADETAAMSLDELERFHIERVIKAEQGKVESAAKRLGIPRSTLYQKLKAYGISSKF
jgi:DNA-binding NtrC family response regulator